MQGRFAVVLHVRTAWRCFNEALHTLAVQPVSDGSARLRVRRRLPLAVAGDGNDPRPSETVRA